MKKLKKYTLYVGLNDKDTRVQKINTLEAYKMISNIALTIGIDGLTISESEGIYKHEDGAIIIEKSLRIEIMFTSEDLINELIKNIKMILNQESIVKQVDLVSSELV